MDLTFHTSVSLGSFFFSAMQPFLFVLTVTLGVLVHGQPPLPSNQAVTVTAVTHSTATAHDTAVTHSTLIGNSTTVAVAEAPFNCLNSQIQCSGHGECISNGTMGIDCQCDKCYVSHDCDPGTRCCYRQQSRVKIFLLSFFTSWTGAPFFVLGAAGLGAAILVLCCGGVCLIGCGMCVEGENAKGSGLHTTGACLVILGALAFLGAVIWHIVNWISVAAEGETYTDGNGVAVCPW